MILVNRLKAFTVMEVLINILLMAILVGMIYFVYSSFVQQVRFYERNTAEQNALITFCTQLKRDFFEAEKITNSTSSFQVVFYDTQVVDYRIGKNYLYRKQGQNKDSLKIRAISKKWISGQNQDLLNQINFQTVLYDNPIDYKISKEYPSNLNNNVDNGG